MRIPRQPGPGRGRLTARALAIACLVISLQAEAYNWSDTYIGYRYGTEFREPANPHEIEKHILTLNHVSGYEYGQNFFNLDILQSSSQDPAAGTNGPREGATEFYLTYRHQLPFGKLFGSPLSFPGIRDIAFSAGFDLNTKNTAFAPRKRLAVAGPTLKTDVADYFDISLLAAYETNHCGLSICDEKTIQYDPYLILNLAWGVPFEPAGVPLRFQGFANFITAKGDTHTGEGTKPEILARPALMLDVGRYLMQGNSTLKAGIGYEYWRNKFGNPGGTGTLTHTPTLNVQWHF